MAQIKILHQYDTNVNINSSIKVQKIIHISDIHIRQGDIERSRYDEYKAVFNKFIQEIRKI